MGLFHSVAPFFVWYSAMNDALSMLSNLTFSERKPRQERRSCTPVLFEPEVTSTDFRDGSLVWETLGYISNMITQRIFDHVISHMQTIGIVQKPTHRQHQIPGKRSEISTSTSNDSKYLDQKECVLLEKTRKQIDSYTDHIRFQQCEVVDMQRELLFTKNHLALLCMKERNAQLLEDILLSESTIDSLNRLQDAYNAYILTLEAPADFRCDIPDHADTSCECFKDFDDFADFSTVSECLDVVLDGLSDNDITRLPAISAITIFYLKLAPNLEGEAVEDAKQLFIEGKDFLLSIWEKFVSMHVRKMVSLDLVYLLFLLEILNGIEGNKGFQSCIQTVTDRIMAVKVDFYAFQEETEINTAENSTNMNQLSSAENRA